MGTSQDAAAEARDAEQKRPEVDIRSLFQLRHNALRERPRVLKMPVAAGRPLNVFCDVCLELR